MIILPAVCVSEGAAEDGSKCAPAAAQTNALGLTKVNPVLAAPPVRSVRASLGITNAKPARTKKLKLKAAHFWEQRSSPQESSPPTQV